MGERQQAYYVGEVARLRSSYKEEDVTLLLKDITGLVKPQSTAEREKLIQSGRHYCEMLPIEYVPSEAYMEAYRAALVRYGSVMAEAVWTLGERILQRRGSKVTLVSLARAGIPIGILLKHCLERRCQHKIPHYAVSIIRGKCIDHNAMRYILERHRADDVLFVDGWIGKGAILGELARCIRAYPGVSPQLAVVADPAGMTKLCGTREDILIPSSCLNSTVSGLISRTFLRDDIIGPMDFHGAVYYGELAGADLSYAFLDAIEREFPDEAVLAAAGSDGRVGDKRNGAEGQVKFPKGDTGLEEVKEIAAHFSIDDINLIKPGIGETTRVLLRRVPWKVLIGEQWQSDHALAHIRRLAFEKGVEIVPYPLRHYKACGLIRKMTDI